MKNKNNSNSKSLSEQKMGIRCMSDNNELHWCVNTEPQNFYSAFLLCILLLQKCPLSSIEKPRGKGKACPFNAFLPPLPVDHLGDRKMAEFYHRG